MNIYLASDHAGFELKNKVRDFLITHSKTVTHGQIQVFDLGTESANSVDFPDYADKLCQKLDPQSKASSESTEKISQSPALGILICGSGQGMAMRANKYPFIRAALVYNDDLAILAREHNDANVICLGSRFCSAEDAERWVTLFINTTFAGGRHETRVAKIGSILS